MTKGPCKGMNGAHVMAGGSFGGLWVKKVVLEVHGFKTWIWPQKGKNTDFGPKILLLNHLRCGTNASNLEPMLPI